MARIEILSGPEAGRTVELGPGKHQIGRHPDSALRLLADTVSTRHVELQVEATGEVRFRDLGSTNGTWSAGVKVSEGEWFAGSELRLGSCRLRLLAETAAAEAAREEAVEPDGGDEALHRRAVEQALAKRRKGGPLTLVLLVLLVAAASFVYWYYGRGAGREEVGRATQAGGGAAAASQGLLEGYESFRSADGADWLLADGLEIRDAALHAGGGRLRASLSPRFPLPGSALELRARPEGVVAWPLISWGRGAEDTPLATWCGAALEADGAILPLPAEAQWFTFGLILEGAGSLRDLEVLPAGEVAAPSTHESHAYLTHGCNLVLRQRDGRSWLDARGAGGTWRPATGGLDFSAGAPGAWLQIEAGPAALESGPFLILSEGGPVQAAPGVRVDDAPGLLLGAEARRLLLRFAAPARVQVVEGGAMLAGPLEATLRWDLSAAYAESARVAREMDRAAQTDDDRAVLAASAELLRDWPLDEAQVEKARSLRRDVIVRGREELNRLEVDTGEALFLNSVSAMQRIRQRALELARRLPGTDLAREAERIAADLEQSRRLALQQVREQEAAYRERLLQVLGGSYPVLGAWLRQQETGQPMPEEGGR